MKKTAKKKKITKTAKTAKTPKKKTGKKRASLKRAGQAVKNSVKKTSEKAKALLDERLSALSPGLRTKLDEVKTQIPLGDLRSLGINVLERARSISENLKKQKAMRPAKGSAHLRVKKK